VAFDRFGSLRIRERKARMGVNPKTGAKLHIPAKKTVTFGVSAVLKSALNGETAYPYPGESRSAATGGAGRPKKTAAAKKH
jgi:hypothetical protein